MYIYSYQITEDKRNVTKTPVLLNPPAYWEGTLRQPCDMFRPIIQLDLGTANSYMLLFNYIKIVEWNRYYFVRSRKVLVNGLLEISCEEDVLYTFESEIKALTGHVARYASKTYPYLTDPRRPISNRIAQEIIEIGTGVSNHFDPSGLSSASLCYMLALADVGAPVGWKTGTSTTWEKFISDPIGIAQTNANRYAMTGSLLSDVIAQLMTGSISSTFFGQGTDGVINCLVFPFDLNTVGAVGTTTPVQVRMFGNSVSTYTAQALYPNPNLKFDFGTFKSTRANADFVDLEPYRRATCYLPYIGFEEVPMEFVGRGGVKIVYYVDVTNGRCQAIIYGLDSGGGIKTILKVRTGQLGVEVPITSTNAAEKGQAALMAGLSAAVAMGSGANPINAIGGLSSALLKPLTMQGSVPASDLARRARPDPYIYIESQIDETPTNYGDYVGYPYEKVLTLSTLSGFAVVDEIFGTITQTSGTPPVLINTATDEEMDAIKTLLRNGVIF